MIGVASALSLCEQGFKVTIAEQHPELGMGASGRNGAQLSYNFADSLASPATLKLMPKILLGLDSAICMKPSIDWDFVRWSVGFFLSTAQELRQSKIL